MTEAFDTAWNVLKDFYFDPNQPYQAGVARMTRGDVQTERGRQTAGGANTRYLDNEDFLQGRGQRLSGGEDVSGGAWNSANRRREPNPFVGQELKRMPIRQAGETDYTAGVNLSSVQSQRNYSQLRFGNTKEQNEAFNRFVYGGGEDANENARLNEFGEDGAAGVLAHEYGHGLINDEIYDAYDTRGSYGMPDTDAKAKLDRAHEIGAYSLQTPGGPLDELTAQRRVQQHPDANKVPLAGSGQSDLKGQGGKVWNNRAHQWEEPRMAVPRVPRPAYAQNAEGWEGELAWEQNAVDDLQADPAFKSKTRQVMDRKFAEENPNVQGKLRPGL